MLKKIAFISFLLLLTAHCSLLTTHAQGTVTIRRGSTVPAACDVTGVIGSPIFWKISGTNPGFYTCIAGVYVYQTNTFGAGLTQKTMLYASATPAAITSTSAPTNGQVLIGSTGNIPALGTPAATANELLVTTGSGTLTFGLATTVIHKAGANFLFSDVTDTTKQFNFTATGISPASLRSIIVPDANISLPITSQTLTFNGYTAARTITFPDTDFAIGETLMKSTANVDMNTATATGLFTCPTGRSCVITRVVVRNASTSLTTASYSFGWNSAVFNDVIANATHTELTDATLYTAINAKVGAKVGTTTQNFRVLMNTLQGGAATTTIDVFGYVF